MQLHRPWKKREKRGNEILAVITLPYKHKFSSAVYQARVLRFQDQLKNGVVLLNPGETLELYSRRPTNLVIERGNI